MRTLPGVVAGGLSFSMGTCKRSSMAYDASSWELFLEKCIVNSMILEKAY